MAYDTIEKWTIGKLAENMENEKFFIPAYQRGYRWTEKQVKDLLNDISEFKIKDDNGNECQYCLQPLIVQLRQDGKYEVVDGQQRLTTIYIFTKFVQEFADKTANLNFELEYETRTSSETSKGSAEYLNDLDSDNCSDESNIDYHYINLAYKAMIDWAKKKSGNGNVDSDTVSKLYKKLIESVFIIWYPLGGKETTNDVFSKVNMGKIPLTNAELIKALLLNSENFKKEKPQTQLKDDSKEYVVQKQTEISVTWDKIEQELNRDSLWYFLTNNKPGGTRIDLIFQLLAEEYFDDKHEFNPLIDKDIKKEDELFSFRVFYSILKDAKTAPQQKLIEDLKQKYNKDLVEKIWEDVTQKFEKIRAWYEDYNQYHLIGYLLAQGKNNALGIQRIINNKGKTDALKALRDEMKKDFDPQMKEGGKREKSIPADDLSRLAYGDQNEKIKKALLMFNIATLVLKSDKQTRFPFDFYKKQGWDIEHIHATKDNSGDADDRMWNLALLNQEINRNYKNKPFKDKREKILEYEKNGTFIPLCTRHVFLKYYTETTQSSNQNNQNNQNIQNNQNNQNIQNIQNIQWELADKIAYLKAMKKTIKEFFKSNKWMKAKLRSGKDKEDN